MESAAGVFCDESYTALQKRACPRNSLKTGMKILLLIAITNLVTIYFINGARSCSRTVFQADAWDSAALLVRLREMQSELIASQSYAEGLKSELESARQLLSAVKTEADDALSDLGEEVKLALGFHKLPLGPTQNMGSEIMFSYGARCLKLKDELRKYMSYEVGGECPVDDVWAQRLMLMGCEPLPRRRCRSRSPVGYVEPTPLPKSLWAVPPDASVVWDPYPCKNYTCLIQRWRYPGTFDCKDCFDLGRREAYRWVSGSDIDYTIDRVLGFKPNGTIRIGLDIGGGSGTFAARMMERNVTILTTSMNFDAPFNSFVSSRGLLSVHATVSQRLPFFENTLDIVHSMHVLSNWIPETMLDFILYDVYRILRPGGLFWLDHFFCMETQLNATFAPMFQRVGFQVLLWNTGKKADKGVDRKEVYLSALFEKPKT